MDFMASGTTGNTQSSALTLEQILGINASAAELLGGNQWNAGDYLFQVTGIDTGQTYEISKEDHPYVGSKAARLEFQLTCLAMDPNSLRDAKGASVSKEAADKFVGKVFKESVMFGNDGLVRRDKAWFIPGPGETPSRSGFNKLHTIIQRILGAEAYEAAKQQVNGDTGKLLSAIANRKFGASLTWSDGGKDKNDPTYRLQIQLDIMNKFVPAQ
jgi:hypothetical protein